MLLAFSVQNFKSIRDLQTLSLEARSDEHLAWSHVVTNGKLRVVKSAVLYGANASGKSNVIEALVWFLIFPRKRVEGLLLLFGFMVLGGFEVERGFIAEGRVQPGSIIEAFDVVENHEFGLLSGFWKR